MRKNQKIKKIIDTFDVHDTGYNVSLDLVYDLTPESDIIESYGFLFYYRTRVRKARYNNVNVRAELVIGIENDKPINKLLDRFIKKSTERFARKDEYSFHFHDKDGTIYYNCMIKSLTEFDLTNLGHPGKTLKSYHLVFDYADNPNGLPEELKLVGNHKIPLNVTDNVLEYIKKHCICRADLIE